MPTTLAYFASAHVGDDSGSLLCHGGLRSPEGQPQGDLFLVRDSSQVTPFEVSNPEMSPRLSHHAAAVVAGRFFVVVGGWDGRRRSNRVHVLDTELKRWLEEPTVVATRPAPPVGLSGHTATLGPDGAIVIVGREGGVREQRRFGDVFQLRWKPGEKLCRYEEVPIKVDSRTGHTAALTEHGLLLVGGRQDNTFQFVKWSGMSLAVGKDSFNVADLGNGGVLRPLPGLRYHAMEQVSEDTFLLHGGQNFKARENTSSQLWSVQVSSGGITSRLIPTDSEIGRYGHKITVFSDGTVMAVGGFSDKKEGVDFVVRLLEARGDVKQEKVVGQA